MRFPFFIRKTEDDLIPEHSEPVKKESVSSTDPFRVKRVMHQDYGILRELHHPELPCR